MTSEAKKDKGYLATYMMKKN